MDEKVMEALDALALAWLESRTRIERKPEAIDVPAPPVIEREVAFTPGLPPRAQAVREPVKERVTIAEMSRITRIPDPTLNHWAAEGLFETLREGPRTVLVPREEVGRVMGLKASAPRRFLNPHKYVAQELRMSAFGDTMNRSPYKENGKQEQST